MPAAKAIVAGRCVSSTSGPVLDSRSNATVAAGIGTAGSADTGSERQNPGPEPLAGLVLPVPLGVAFETERLVEPMGVYVPRAS